MKAFINYAIDPDTAAMSVIVTIGDEEFHFSNDTISEAFECVYDVVVPDLKNDGYEVHCNFDGFMSLTEKKIVESIDGNVIQVNFG